MFDYYYLLFSRENLFSNVRSFYKKKINDFRKWYGGLHEVFIFSVIAFEKHCVFCLQPAVALSIAYNRLFNRKCNQNAVIIRGFFFFLQATLTGETSCFQVYRVFFLLGTPR